MCEGDAATDTAGVGKNTVDKIWMCGHPPNSQVTGREGIVFFSRAAWHQAAPETHILMYDGFGRIAMISDKRGLHTCGPDHAGGEANQRTGSRRRLGSAADARGTGMGGGQRRPTPKKN